MKVLATILIIMSLGIQTKELLAANGSFNVGVTVTSPASTSTGGGGGGGGGSGTIFPSAIFNISAVPGTRSITISWNTTNSTIGTVSWGKNSHYDLGTIAGTTFGTVHTVVIDNLTPGTNYMIRIEAVDVWGLRAAVEGIHVRTLSLGATTPQNVSNFVAEQKGEGIDLKWKNPTGPNFDGVRIVRSESFFPVDPEDGEVVYEGKGQHAFDQNVIDGRVYYYSAFAKDKSGAWSSGVVAEAAYSIDGEIEIPNPLDLLPDAPNVDPKIKSLTIGDFIFLQDGKQVMARDGKLLIDGKKNLTILINYDRIPEVLKTIAVTLTDPTDSSKVFKFLLRVNGEKTAYEATIGALGRKGEYALYIAVIDYKNRGMAKVAGSLLASVEGEGSAVTAGFSAVLFLEFLKLLTIVLLVIRSLKVILKEWEVGTKYHAA